MNKRNPYFQHYKKIIKYFSNISLLFIQPLDTVSITIQKIHDFSRRATSLQFMSDVFSV